MSKRVYTLFLKDIIASAEKIIRYINDKSFEEFIQNELLADGVIRNLEIIGEAVKNIPSQVKQKYANVEWKKISGLQDTLIHEYFGLDYELLWDIVKTKIPPLKEQIEAVLEEEKGKWKIVGVWFNRAR